MSVPSDIETLNEKEDVLLKTNVNEILDNNEGFQEVFLDDEEEQTDANNLEYDKNTGLQISPSSSKCKEPSNTNSNEDWVSHNE